MAPFLKKLKLAGFKSFVDPTTLTFPGQLSAVVGPNGSGKSNIIDAVSWVLGESSMKYLRGGVLTDVIFNGSTARKPVGQASIELIFDNQEGVIGGEYSKYAEISIKRLITRDSDSSYYLNNTPCRRRDILDIFAGTGLGPRSYSIIGQNMVSRIVESKPDDMRAYLEEAAGISKYKERRHETELRIKHTRDNLSRVNDLRSELERQLNQLKRQASDAEKYKTFKEQERTTKSQWHAIQWRDLDSQLVQYTLNIAQEETAQEAYHAELVETETAMEQRRLDQRATTDTFQEVQKRFYTTGNEIARIEQDLVHLQQRKDQLENDLKQAEEGWQEANQQLEEVQDQLEEVTLDLTTLEPGFEEAVIKAKAAVEALAKSEIDSQNWQTRWDSFHQQTMKVNQQVEVGQARIQHLEQKLQGIKTQQSKIQQEQCQINFTQTESEMQTLAEQLDELNEQVDLYVQELDEIKAEMTEMQAKRQQTVRQLDEARNELQRARGKQASMEALQQAALGQNDNPIQQWLAEHQLDKNSRLAQGIEVEQGWEVAVERVLGPYLQAVCVDQLSSITSKVADLKQGQLMVFANHSSASASSSSTGAESLMAKVTSSLPIHSLLSGIYIAENAEAAESLLPTLRADESVITRDGLWMSPTWLHVSHEKDPTAGVFQREQALKELAVSIQALDEKQQAMEELQMQQQDELAELDHKREAQQQALNQHRARASETAAQHKAKKERCEDMKAKAELLQEEQEEYQAQELQTSDELEQTRTSWHEAQTAKEKFNEERETLIVERENARRQLQEDRQTADSAKEESHQLEIRLQSSRSQQGALRQTAERMKIQLASLADRKQSLEKDLSQAEPLEQLKETLEEGLAKHVTVEAELATARAAMEAMEQELDRLEKQRHRVEQGINRVRTNLETLRLESQGLKLKEETLQEYIKELNFSLEEVLQGLPPEANASEWQAEYERLTQKIHRLGSINLIAVEEYTTCLERKDYLDKQFDDLTDSLTTLENAIAKIDRETRVRFKEVFDKINTRFQELFPIVFGGGHATLELSDENILEAGITVMACPPGKRNSSIQLLSGGEKTMTALALIFSIFYLNPSPLCLLDEVDAALDDMNVSRYCDLVKKMSEKTQFIFISHNKLAIEMAQHLVGITMHEPGVSRTVTVDMEEAITMATAS